MTMKKLFLLAVFLVLTTTVSGQITQSSVGRTTGASATNANVWLGPDTYLPEPAPSYTPLVALAGAGAGNVDDGAHYYKVTFVTSTGETTPSASSAVVTVADKTANGQVAVSRIAIGTSMVTARKLYRTKVGGTVFYLLATIGDNTTATYTDNIADASLGAEAPTINTTADLRYTFGPSGPEFGDWFDIYNTGSGAQVRVTSGNVIRTHLQNTVTDLTEGAATAFVRIGDSTYAAGLLLWSVSADRMSTSAKQELVGITTVSAVLKGTAETCTLTDIGTAGLAESESGSTLTCTLTCASNSNATVDVLADCTSSLAQDHLQIRWMFLGNYTFSVEAL